MGLSINTNMTSLVTQNQMSKNERQIERAVSELASGNRFSESSQSDPAGRAIAENLRAEVAGKQAAQSNVGQAQSLTQIIESSLSEQSNILVRMREIAVQGASDNYSDEDRNLMQQEFQQLKLELDRISRSTQFAGKSLLTGQAQVLEFQVGTRNTPMDRIQFANKSDTTMNGLDVEDLNVEEKSDARDSLENLDSAIRKVNGTRAQVGATQSRLDRAESNLDSSIESNQRAYSKVADTDVADAVARLRKAQVIQQYQVGLLSMENKNTDALVRLIG